VIAGGERRLLVEGLLQDINGLFVKLGRGQGAGIFNAQARVGMRRFFDHLPKQVGGPEGVAEIGFVGEQQEPGQFNLGDGVVLFDMQRGLEVIDGERILVQIDENLGGFDEWLGALRVELDGGGKRGERCAHLVLGAQGLTQKELVMGRVANVEIECRAELRFGLSGAAGVEKCEAEGREEIRVLRSAVRGGLVVGDRFVGLVLEQECVAKGVRDIRVVRIGCQRASEGLLRFGELLKREEGVSDRKECLGIAEVFAEHRAREGERFGLRSGVGLPREQAGEVVGGDPGIGVGLERLAVESDFIPVEVGLGKRQGGERAEDCGGGCDRHGAEVDPAGE